MAKTAPKSALKPPKRRIPPNETPTQKAIRLAGGPKAIAEKLDIKSLWSIYKWLEKDEIPSKRASEVCEMGGNQVLPHQVSPYHRAPS